ncbi:hypothetical protein TWF718_008554 [Orbilia javanica]|uniref:Carboxylesterase type B domain-containing protein n=1 Tax=Orbilia javanica TaxID=47235 RepID=A0AAN8RCI7_9PEZI
MAYGGTLGTSLFQNSISTSPYSPPQYNYNAQKPTNDYIAFAQLAGCYNPTIPATSSVITCLRNKDTLILQQANSVVSASGIVGTWAFVPVTDGVYVQQLPSQQLESGSLNGKKHLTIHNAEEGALFVQPGIVDADSFKSYVKLLFPSFSPVEISAVLALFSPPSSGSGLLFPTAGDAGATALGQSAFATGYQQAAYNLYAEVTFICPSYWIADSFSRKKNGGYKYQYSVAPAMHTTDVAAYFGPIGGIPNLSPQFQRDFMKIWGTFITSSVAGIPGLPILPPFSLPWGAFMANLNQTGGVPGMTPIPPVGAPYPANVQPGLIGDFSLKNAYTWEGGRGWRCQFWKSVAAKEADAWKVPPKIAGSLGIQIGDHKAVRLYEPRNMNTLGLVATAGIARFGGSLYEDSFVLPDRPGFEAGYLVLRVLEIYIGIAKIITSNPTDGATGWKVMHQNMGQKLQSPK